MSSARAVPPAGGVATGAVGAAGAASATTGATAAGAVSNSSSAGAGVAVCATGVADSGTEEEILEQFKQVRQLIKSYSQQFVKDNL